MPRLCPAECALSLIDHVVVIKNKYCVQATRKCSFNTTNGILLLTTARLLILLTYHCYYWHTYATTGIAQNTHLILHSVPQDAILIWYTLPSNPQSEGFRAEAGVESRVNCDLTTANGSFKECGVSKNTSTFCNISNKNTAKH